VEQSDHDCLWDIMEKVYLDADLYGTGYYEEVDGKVVYIPMTDTLKHGHLSTSAEEERDG